jgi:hypothetical protein
MQVTAELHLRATPRSTFGLLIFEKREHRRVVPKIRPLMSLYESCVDIRLILADVRFPKADSLHNGECVSPSSYWAAKQ